MKAGLFSRCAVSLVGWLWHREAEADLATLSSCAGLAAEALNRSFVGAQTADFLHDAFGLKLRLETFEGAINRFAFSNLNVRHTGGFFGLCGLENGRLK